jgi:hypothetical protein
MRRTSAALVDWRVVCHLTAGRTREHRVVDPKAVRPSPVTPAQRSPAALPKAVTKATTGGPVHSFATLLEDMAAIAASRIQPAGSLPAFTVITTPAPIRHCPSNCSASPHCTG